MNIMSSYGIIIGVDYIVGVKDMSKFRVMVSIWGIVGVSIVARVNNIFIISGVVGVSDIDSVSCRGGFGSIVVFGNIGGIDDKVRI